MSRHCTLITTPAGTQAQVQLTKPIEKLTERERVELYATLDAAAALLDSLPDTSCHSCGALGRFPDCYPAKRRKGVKCCESCDHTERPRATS